VWGYRRIVGKDGRTFRVILDLRWGDGSNIRLWHDERCGDVALKERFPDLFGIADAKDASVAAHLEFYGGYNQWNVCFARVAHDLEVDTFASFF
jgi:hypothetical protein